MKARPVPGEQDGGRRGPRPSVERQCAGKERLEAIRQMQESTVGRGLAAAHVVGSGRRRKRM
jgi:hypothetical protein